jgi:hypothetical protein
MLRLPKASFNKTGVNASIGKGKASAHASLKVNNLKGYSMLIKGCKMSWLIRHFVTLSIFLLPHSAYAWTDACWLLDTMASSGPDITFQKYKGSVVEGVGYFGDERNGYIEIYCDKNAIINPNPNIGSGMIFLYVGGDERSIYSLGLKRGDKVYFRGEAKRWKWKKYIDSKRAYIRIELDYDVIGKK